MPAIRVCEAIFEYLGDMVDLHVVERRLKALRSGKSSTVTLDTLMKRYGVDG